MVESIGKENLRQIFSAYSRKIHSLEQFSIYIREVFNDLTTRSEIQITALDLNRFHLYIQLPFFLSKTLFKALLQYNQYYLSFEEFENGLKKIYFDSIPKRVKFVFEFFDISHENIIYSYDIIIILRQFHMIMNSSDISHLDRIINYALGNIQQMDYNQWKELLVNNSDLFTLTMVFFAHYKPFHDENIIYCAKITKTQTTERNIPTKTYELLAESTDLLYTYINQHFKKSFDYQEKALSDNDDDLKDLIAFENDKIVLLDNLKEISKRIANDTKISPKKKFETQITSDSKTLNEIQAVDRKKRNKEMAGTTIQSNLILSKLKLQNGILTKVEGSDLSNKSLTINTRIDCLLFTKGKLKKCTLNMINEDIFLFKYSKQNIKTYNKMLSLKRFFIAVEENFKIQGSFYFKVELLSDIDYKPYPTNFIFESKDSGRSFIKNLRERLQNESIAEHYDIVEEIMIEENGTILKAYNKKNIEPHIIKQISKKNKDMQSQFDLVNWELSAFQFLLKSNHSSLLKAVDKYETLHYIYLVYEFPTEGQLLFYMQKNHIVSLKKITEIFLSIALSIQYFHSYGFIYGGCISSNVFVYKSKKAYYYKLINFEQSQVSPYNKMVAPLIEPKATQAPELSDGKNVFNRSIDIWNLGNFLFSMIYGHKAFKDNDLKKKRLIFPDISIESHDYELLTKIQEIITGCLQPDMKNRISLDRILALCKSIQ